MALTQVSAGLLDTQASAQGFRNRIINGSMAVWQRGTSFTGITNSPTYTVDRWGAFVAAVISGEQVLQSSSVPTGQGFKYSAAFGRTAGNTNTNSIWFVQLIESVNMLDLAGQSATLSFWAKAGANYSGGNLSVLVNSGTSADQSLATFSAGPCTGYTGNASVINITQALTTTWTKFTFTGSVGGSAQELGVAFGYTPTGTAGADDNIYITGVQLEKGTVATDFERLDYGRQLIQCQRYYEKSYDVGTTPGTATTTGRVTTAGNAGATTTGYIEGYLGWKVNKRGAPTVTIYDMAGASAKCTRLSTGIGTSNGQTVATSTEGETGCSVFSSGSASGNCMQLHYTAASEL